MSGGSNIRAIGDGESDVVAPEAVEDREIDLEDQDSGQWIDAEWDDPEREDGLAAPRSFRWLWLSLVLLAIAGWTGFFGWTYHADMLAGATLAQWTGWITAWAVPVLLIVTVWLISMRNSSREAERFGAIAATLSSESERLETRLTVINRELSLAREFLGAQSRELDSLGRVAGERLSERAAELDALIIANGDRISSIATVSAAALDNMGRLRDDLPVIANSAKDVSNQIGTAGMTAHTHIAELIGGFQRLNDFGKASEDQVTAIQARIDVTLAAFEARMHELETHAEERLGALAARSDALRTDLDTREIEALAAMGRRADTLGEDIARKHLELDSAADDALSRLTARLGTLTEGAEAASHSLREGEDTALAVWNERVEVLKSQLTDAIAEIQSLDERALDAANAKLDSLREEAETVDAGIAQRDAIFARRIEERRKALAQSEEEALALIAGRFASLNEAIENSRAAQIEHTEWLSQRSLSLAEEIAALNDALERAAKTADLTQADIAGNAEQIGAALSDGQQSLSRTDEAVQALTDACVRLLELVQASARHIRSELPDALTDAEERLTGIHAIAGGLDAAVRSAVEQADAVRNKLGEANNDERRLIAQIDDLQVALDGTQTRNSEAITALKNGLAEIHDESDRVALMIEDRLASDIARLENAARSTPAAIAAELQEKIGILANDMADRTGAALEKSLRDGAQATIDEYETSLAEANRSGQDTAALLRDQLAKVDDLAANLESRVARARDQAQEQVDNDFARRMALLTESLNSHSIDIAKSLSADVSDTAWAAYLKGDRSVFTRRAIRLLDNTQAREIADLYDGDQGFRENVSRYIHDFEAMLRSILSTRDGHALGVTILSSDMGKLYVALAQAIERLRS